MNKTEPKWLIPFKGQGSSGTYTQNFVWKSDSIYVMDNHRAALWCWLQELDLSSKYDFFHLDRHFDTGPIVTDGCEVAIEGIAHTTLESYLNLRKQDGDALLISWGNYISVFIEFYSATIDQWFFVTHQDGEPPHLVRPEVSQEESFSPEDAKLLEELIAASANQPVAPPQIRSLEEKHIEAMARTNLRLHEESSLAREGTGRSDINFWEVIQNLTHWMNNDRKWIVNIDLDYFFIPDGENYILAFTETFIRRFFEELKQSYDAGHIAVLTVALSPETCGGWDDAQRLCKIFSNTFKLSLDFTPAHTT